MKKYISAIVSIIALITVTSCENATISSDPLTINTQGITLTENADNPNSALTATISNEGTEFNIVWDLSSAIPMIVVEVVVDNEYIPLQGKDLYETGTWYEGEWGYIANHPDPNAHISIKISPNTSLNQRLIKITIGCSKRFRSILLTQDAAEWQPEDRPNDEENGTEE